MQRKLHLQELPGHASVWAFSFHALLPGHESGSSPGPRCRAATGCQRLGQEEACFTEWDPASGSWLLRVWGLSPTSGPSIFSSHQQMTSNSGYRCHQAPTGGMQLGLTVLSLAHARATTDRPMLHGLLMLCLPPWVMGMNWPGQCCRCRLPEVEASAAYSVGEWCMACRSTMLPSPPALTSSPPLLLELIVLQAAPWALRERPKEHYWATQSSWPRARTSSPCWWWEGWENPREWHFSCSPFKAPPEFPRWPACISLVAQARLLVQQHQCFCCCSSCAVPGASQYPSPCFQRWGFPHYKSSWTESVREVHFILCILCFN